MKRFHVHLAVDDLAKSVDFYSKLFGQQPSVARADYAKWMLDDPMLNFAISARGHALGVNHFGFQAENVDELHALKQCAEAAAGEAVLDQGETACCYALSDKHWTVDPSGFAWEHYHTMGEIQEFGVDRADTSVDCCVPVVSKANEACCVPTATVSLGSIKKAGSCC